MTVYGAALNDREQLQRLAAAFEDAPYKQPPKRPVLYIKPRNCLMGGAIPVPAEPGQIEIAATLGLLLGRDASRVGRQTALDHIDGICLALDASAPYDSYYRPPVRQRCRDGFLRLGAFSPFDRDLLDHAIETFVDDTIVHAWSPRRLFRDAATLIADISAFTTLAAGDLLLIGTAHDAPRLAGARRIEARCGRLPSLSAQLGGEVG